MPHPSQLTIMQVAAPALAGGLESVLLELAGGLTASGHRAVLAAVLEAGRADHPMLATAVARGVEVIPVEVAPRAYRQEYLALRRAIGAISPDVVHTHGYRADLIGGLAARNAGVPWVSTAHGFSGGDLKNRLYEWLQVRAFRRADAVIAVSRHLGDRLRRSGVASDRVLVQPNAWAPVALAPRVEARARMGVPEDEFTIGWVGRLSPEKGADVFLDALALLPDRRWCASIVGDGAERPQLVARARALGIADRVHWHGLVANAASLYAAFDVWVLSSRTEGTPMALFEAMAARVPAVVTAVGGVPDVVTPREALVVPSESPGLIAAAVEAVRSDPDGARRRADEAHRRLVDRFAPGGWVDAHVALYRALVDAGTPGK